MALHKLETVAKPAADAPASEWEAYLAGLKQPEVGDNAGWEEYFRLEEEASEEAPASTYANRTPTAHPDLLGGGSAAK